MASQRQVFRLEERPLLTKLAAIFFVCAGVMAWQASTSFAQFNTPTIDGVIGAGEYGTHTDGNNQQTNGGTVWHMTWDATNLYIGISGANVLEGAVIYVDGNPIAPINGGTNADGTLVGQEYDNTNFAALQFRADHVSYFKDGYREHRTADGANGWSGPTTFSGGYFSNGSNVREYAIPWSNITGGIPPSFNWFGYVVSGTSFVYGEMPTENGEGSIGTTAREQRYFTVSNTTNGGSTKPFSRNSYVFNSATDISGFGGISVYDFTMNSSGQQIFRSADASTWTIGGNLRVDAGTIHFDNTTGAATVSGNVVISSGGTLNLGNVIGGDLNLAGNWTNNGAFNHNSRTVTFNGTGTQTISGSSTSNFGFLTVNMGTSNSNLLDAQSLITLAAVTNPLAIQNGTFKLSSNSTITPFTTGAGATIPATGGFWLNGGTVNAGGFSWALNGLLRISNGSLGIGTGSGNSLNYFTGSTITIEGGSLTIAGRLARDTGAAGNATNYTQTGGTVTVVTSGSTSSTRAGFDLGATGSSFTMSGGTIVMQRGTTNASDYLNLAATHNVTGGTLQIGNASTPAAQIIMINSATPIFNFTVNSANATAELATNALDVNGNLAVNAGALNANNLNINLAGNWTNNGSFTAGSGTVTMNGASPQTMSGSTFNNLTINNSSGVTLLTDETVSNTLTLTSGNISTGSNKMIIAAGGTVSRTSGHVVGNLQKNFATGSNVARSFEVGTGSDYTPVDVTVTSVSAAGNVTANSTSGDHPSIGSANLDAAKSVNRYWTLTKDGSLAFTNYSSIFNFVGGDLDGGANTNNLNVGKLDAGTWTYPTVGTRTATSTQATGMTSFSDFQLAEPLPAQMTYTVINTNDAGSGSLRQAIIDANAHTNLDASTPDLIHFNITSGTGPFTISPLSALPTITDPVIIDGLTQAGASCSSWPPTLKIELNGASAGSGVNGLTITAGNSAVRGLVINRFSSDGIEMSSNGSNVFECNLIGTDVVGATDLGNSAHGLFVSNVSSNTIGGTATGARNLISGNSHGIQITGSGATGNLVQGNLIGTNAGGTAGVGNGGSGVFISGGATNNTIGGTAAGARNVISSNSNDGVEMRDANTNGNFVQGNYLGTDITGALDLGNNGPGVLIMTGASNNTIGGTAAGAGNLISGNGNRGVFIQNVGTSGNLIQGNFIGTNASGNAGVGNTNGGIVISQGTTNNTVGGAAAGTRNLISGNIGPGVLIQGTVTSGNLVQGNYIGTNAAGTAAIANQNGSGVEVFNGTTNNTIGGTAPGAGNVISGNGGHGVYLHETVSGNLVQGNLIGVKATGIGALGNGHGIELELYASNNTIGGTTAGAGNVISANAQRGIFMTSSCAGNLVQGNFIGTDITGALALGNGNGGVLITASDENTLGGTVAGAGNIIANNNGNGVEISGYDSRIRVQGNAIFSNSSLGIDLALLGVTANDNGDGDLGPNNLQNYPVLNCAHPSGGNTEVKGSLNSTANTAFTLEFFSNAAADPSGFGEGETFQLSTTVTTGGTGNVNFTVSLPTALALGQFVSATATDPSGSTSEFSKSIAVTNELLANAGADAEICASGSTAIGGSPAATGGATPYMYSWSPTTALNDASLPNPTASPATTTAYTLTVTDANGCAATDQVTVTVNPLPTVTFNPAGPYCINAAAVDLTPFVSPSGGTFSGSGVTSAGIFTPSSAGTGTHTITYTFTSGSNCTNSASQDIVVNPLPNVTFTAVSAVCVNAAAIDLTSYVSPSGGTFSGTGVTSAGIFTPSSAGAGTHTITYSFTDGNTCMNTASQDIVVNPLPTVTFNPAGPYCLNSSAVDLTSFVSPSGGTFSGTGVTSAGIFTPNTSGIGTHTITYSFTDGNNCTNTASQNIAVETLPTVTFNPAGPYCVNGAAVDLTTFVLPAGGTFSGDGVTTAGIFTPSTAGTGTHTITYTFTSGSNCTNSASQDIVVNPLPVVTFNAVSAVCVNAAAIDLTSYVSPAGGTFSGTGVTSAGIFTPSSAGAGTHTITYSFTDGNTCTNTASQDIVVNPLPTVTFNPVGPFLVTDAAVNLASSVSPSGGTFSGPGISGTMFDPSVAGVGTHTITYSFTDGNSCTNSASQNITVNPATPAGKAFVFLANKITLKRTKQNTPAGDMHSNGALTVEKGNPSTYNSNLTAVGKITINKDNTINGEVTSQTAISNSGTINGDSNIEPVDNEPLPGLSYSAGGLNKTVPSGGALALNPGSYNIVTLNGGGTLKLTSGEYFFNQLKYPGSKAVIEIDLSSGDPVTINVVSNLQLGKEVAIQLLPNGEDDSELVTFNTQQSTAVKVGREAYFLGSLNAPNSVVTLDKNSQLRGSMCVKELIVERDCLFLHHDSPGSLPGPGNLPKVSDDDEVIRSHSSLVSDYALEQNYPNPFNPSTTINFALPEAGEVSLAIYNMSGQLVRKLVHGEYASGRYEVLWDAKDDHGARVASGVYLYVLKAGEFIAQRKLVLMK